MAEGVGDAPTGADVDGGPTPGLVAEGGFDRPSAAGLTNGGRTASGTRRCWADDRVVGAILAFGLDEVRKRRMW
jgi:hypothetical protein